MPGDVDKAVDMLKQLLSDDATKEKLSSVIGNVISDNKTDSNDADDIDNLDTDDSYNDEESEINSDNLQGLANILNSDSIMNIIGGGGNDKRVALLNALKPYLNDRRNEKVDGAIKVLKLVELSSNIGITNLFK